jgi:hypothetical protein
MTTCPVCGRGRLAAVGPYNVSHLDCVESQAEQIERARTYKGIEAYACPLCTYSDGIFIESCQVHKDMHELETTMRQAEREAAFWKWLWHQSTQTIATDGFDKHPWIAHMRERFEKEAE